MKRIAVIASHLEYAHYLRANLERYFGGHAEITAYSLRDVAQMEWIPAEYVAVSAFTIFQRMQNKISKDSELINISISLDRENLKQLECLPKDTRAYLVSIDYRLCMQVIMQIYELGYRDLDLVAYYGEGNPDPSIEIAITPNETAMMPPGIRQVINIGERIIDANTIIEIADRLGIRDVFAARTATEARIKSIVKTTWAERLLGENESLTEQINVLIGLIDQGIVITDVAGRIYICNQKARHLLRSRSEILSGFNVTELLPEIDIYRLQDSEEEDIITIGGNTLIVSSTRIKASQEIRGSILTLSEFRKVEEKQHQIRTRLSGSLHTATHHFSDIVGVSSSIAYTIDTAKRMARSDSSVLITGESGTGKEVFAQSIHNRSTRKDYNFVAVNCAAIPESLLESEMFGYEEGAFTGARKGGKIGYFELAHNGTIFLDEIAEMPMQLQSKLLRVIEEKRMARVGSHSLIDVDIRIIAATNKDIFDLINRNLFREDLYYRLNVLPLRLPSLRERKEDIPLLAERFMQNLGASFRLDPDAMRMLIEAKWRGNIRELRNLVEYLENLGKSAITERDLALVMHDEKAPPTQTQPPSLSADSREAERIRRFLHQHEAKRDLLRFLLHELAHAPTGHASMGRYALFEAAERQGLPYSEKEVRTGLHQLRDAAFVVSKRGRGGSRLTESGMRLYRQIVDA